jgi:hypothetical protein
MQIIPIADAKIGTAAVPRVKFSTNRIEEL